MGLIVGLSMVRELGPVVTAILVGAAGSGSGFTGGLGSMKVTERIDAMRALGVNYIKRLVVPRVMLTMIALPVLTIIASTLGVFGGMVDRPVRVQRGLPPVLQLADRIHPGGGHGGRPGQDGHLRPAHRGHRLPQRPDDARRHGGSRAGHHGYGGDGRPLSVFVSDFFLTKFFWWLEGW
ncbi:MAG: ABC transporter permease [Candidatus Moduliflexus flocculans]|nr:ABC transporter permease [Candidatus Moduliflexus flocculans]